MTATIALQNNLKKTAFYEMLNSAGRVFVVVRYSKDVVIGDRGFTREEEKNGLVLVFNKQMVFSWDKEGISVTLVFGTSPQKCFIPSHDIISVYSPELNSQLLVMPAPYDEPVAEKPEKTFRELSGGREPASPSDKVISINSRKNKSIGQG